MSLLKQAGFTCLRLLSDSSVGTPESILKSCPGAAHVPAHPPPCLAVVLAFSFVFRSQNAAKPQPDFLMNINSFSC